MKHIFSKLNHFSFNLRLAVLDEAAGRWIVDPSHEISQ